MPAIDTVVFSRTLAPVTRPGLRITSDDPVAVVTALKAEPGKDIWLYGGGDLFRTLLAAGLVDTVELAVIPVLLGDGIPLLPPGRLDHPRAERHEGAAGQRHRGAGVCGAGRRGPGAEDSAS